jgi:hypothetical protein
LPSLGFGHLAPDRPVGNAKAPGERLAQCRLDEKIEVSLLGSGSGVRIAVTPNVNARLWARARRRKGGAVRAVAGIVAMLKGCPTRVARVKHTNNVINGVFSGMSNKVNDKLAQCERAIRALESLRERQDKSEFEYHFCAYIGFVDAINNYVPRLLKEQLRSPTLAKTWLDRLKADVDFATVIGLRNSDVHSDALRVSRQNINVALPGYQVQTQAGVLVLLC